MADAGTPDWWLDRLYKRLRDRRPQILEWDNWYSGDHPAPQGYEKAGPMIERLLEATGMNVLAVVTNAGHERQHVEGFKVSGKINDEIWAIWQSNNFDRASSQVFLEEKALSESYVMVDPNPNANGDPTMTPEHPEQAITEDLPLGGGRMGLKVLVDETEATPIRYAYVLGPSRVDVYAAPTRSGGWALRPMWEYQESLSGKNPLGECPLVPFSNRPRMLKAPRPEFAPAIPVQRRINKTLLDRLAMQDAGAFKAKWATGLDIPVDPATGEPVEPFKVAIDRLFVNESKEGKFGQFEAEDIQQVLKAVEADVTHAAVLVPTPPDQILGTMVNVSAEGLKSAQASLISRVKQSMRADEEPLETVARLALKAAGKDVPDVASMTTIWRNPEFRTEGEMVDAGIKAISAGVPEEAVWERYFGATPQEITDWRTQLDERATREAGIGVKAVRDAAASGN